MPDGLLEQRLPGAVRAETDGLKAVVEMADNVERAGADGTSGAEHDDALETMHQDRRFGVNGRGVPAPPCAAPSLVPAVIIVCPPPKRKTACRASLSRAGVHFAR